MDLQQFHQNRILLHYVFMKLSNRLGNLNMEDLNNFFDEEGWKLEDMDKMTIHIQNWIRAKEAIKRRPMHFVLS